MHAGITCLRCGAQAFTEELELAAGVQPDMIVGKDGGAGGAAARSAGSGAGRGQEGFLEESTAEVLAGAAKLEQDMLYKITKPLGARPGGVPDEVWMWGG